MPLNDFMSQIMPPSRSHSCEIVMDRAKVPANRNAPGRTGSGDSFSFQLTRKKSPHARWNSTQDDSTLSGPPATFSRGGGGSGAGSSSSSRSSPTSSTTDTKLNTNNNTTGLGQPPVRRAPAQPSRSSSLPQLPASSSSRSTIKNIKSGRNSDGVITTGATNTAPLQRKSLSTTAVVESKEKKISPPTAPVNNPIGGGKNNDHGQKLVDLIQRLSMQAAMAITGQDPSKMPPKQQQQQQGEAPKSKLRTSSPDTVVA